jgi:hypothetical protein
MVSQGNKVTCTRTLQVHVPQRYSKNGHKSEGPKFILRPVLAGDYKERNSTVHSGSVYA